MEETRKLFSQLVCSITGDECEHDLPLTGSVVSDDVVEMDENGIPDFNARFAVQVGTVEQECIEELFDTRLFLDHSDMEESFTEIYTSFSQLIDLAEKKQFVEETTEIVPRDVLGIWGV